MSTANETARNLRREHMDDLAAPWLRTLRQAHDDAVMLVNLRHAGLQVGRQALQRAEVMSEWRHGYAHAMLRCARVDWKADATALWAEESIGRVDAATTRLLAKGANSVALLRAEAGAKYRARCSAKSRAAAVPRQPSLERKSYFMSTAVNSGERATVA